MLRFQESFAIICVGLEKINYIYIGQDSWV